MEDFFLFVLLQFVLFFCIKDELCVLFFVGFGFCGFGNSYTKRQGNKNIHFFLFMSHYNDYKCRKNSTNFVILLERILECDILSKQYSFPFSLSLFYSLSSSNAPLLAHKFWNYSYIFPYIFHSS